VNVLRFAGSDAWLVALSAAYGVLLLHAPSAPLLAIGMWWTANTVAHNFIHLPFFRSRALNRLFSAYLTLVMGVPQSVWRDRHLAHHAGRPWSRRLTRDSVLEIGLVAALWGALAWLWPTGFATVYLPGSAAGLLLCQLQGYYEHARGTTSHYGRIYNTLFFNDGYHVEHHARPSLHWSQLGRRPRAGGAESGWPPILRWLDGNLLDALERLVLVSPRLRRLIVDVHERAFRRLLVDMRAVKTVTIVGGGLFPRTALVLQRLLPDATLTIVDANAAHLDVARSFLGDTVALRREVFNPGRPVNADLVIAPLAYIGDRRRLYDLSGIRYVVVHDWIWSRHGRSVIVSCFLLKRINLVCRSEEADARPVAS
jgi:hypothetical protein